MKGNKMSAFLVEDKTINLVADLLCFGYKDEWIPAKCKAWNLGELAMLLKRMNLEALIDRYPKIWRELTEHQGITDLFIEDEEGLPIPGYSVSREMHPLDESLIQKYKHVQCYLYQCSEGDVIKESMFKTVESLLLEMQNLIVYELPTYQEASWE